MMSDAAALAEFEALQARMLDVLATRSNERTVSESDMVASVVFISYENIIEENKKSKHIGELAEPPKVRMQAKKDGGSFPARLEINCDIQDLKEIPEVCQRLDDNSWNVQTDLVYAPAAVAAIREHAEHALSVKGKEDEDGEFYAKVRSFLSYDEQGVPLREKTEDGTGTVFTLATKQWYKVEKGAKVRFKAYDAPDRPSIYRAKHEKPFQNKYKIRRYVNLKLTKIEPQLYVGFREDKEKDEKRFSTYFSCEIGGQTIISEDDDFRICESEQMHRNRNPHAHQLVPVPDLKAGRASVPATCYFLLQNMHTPYNRNNYDPNSQGISIHRMEGRPEDYLKKNDADQYVGKFNVSFNVKQWFGKVPTTVAENRDCQDYLVKVLVFGKNGDDDKWMAFGITDAEAYAAIIHAHSNTALDKRTLYLPVHLECALWKKGTLEDSKNSPTELNNREELASFKGFYVFVLSSLVPDYLRYFRSNGLRVSQQFVEEEFGAWIQVNETAGKIKTKRRALNLEHRDHTGEKVATSPQASNAFLSQDVVPMGNGTLLNPESDDGYGKYHAFTGNGISLLDDTRDFFVLTSYTPTAEELQKHYPPYNREPADDYVNELKGRLWGDSSKFYYWIFAVKRDALVNQRKDYDTSKLPPLGPAPEVGEKRQAPEDPEDEAELAASEALRAKLDEEDDY